MHSALRSGTLGFEMGGAGVGGGDSVKRITVPMLWVFND